MRVMHLGDHVGDGELQPVQNMPFGLIFRRETEFGAEVQQDVGDMRDDQIAMFEERRGKGGWGGFPLHERHHRIGAVRTVRHVGIGDSRLFESQAHEFAAPLQVVPVIEFVFHDAPSSREENGRLFEQSGRLLVLPYGDPKIARAC